MNIITIYIYRSADKSLARPGRKQATATEDCDFHIHSFIHSVFCLTTGPKPPLKRFLYPIYNNNLMNINTIYIYNKTSIKRKILNIKQNTSGSRSG
jgi:hypothetical protein